MGAEIPMVMRLEAETAGLDETATERAWAKFQEWHRKTFVGRDFRLKDWRRQIDFELRDRAESVPRTNFAALERQRKAAEDAAYAREAVSLRDWLERHATDEERARSRHLLAWLVEPESGVRLR